MQTLLRLSLALALKGQAIVDQGLNRFGALFLGFGHGPQASKPNMLSWRGLVFRVG
jgi:hypothetical protein